MVLGIDVVFLHVKDPELMAKWYQDVLGVRLGFTTPDKSWLELDFRAESPVTRFALDYPQGERSDVEKQPIMISFKVDNIHSMVRTLEGRGISFFGPPTLKEEGSSLVVTFKDPEGNWIQLSQRK